LALEQATSLFIGSAPRLAEDVVCRAGFPPGASAKCAWALDLSPEVERLSFVNRLKLTETRAARIKIGKIVIFPIIGLS